MFDRIPDCRSLRAVFVRPAWLPPAMRLCVLLGIAPLAVGCGGEPSEKDMRAALERQADAARQAAGAFGAAVSLEYHEVQKLGCEKTGQGNAYVCDVEFDVTAPIVGRQKQSGRIRFVEGDDGWVAMNP